MSPSKNRNTAPKSNRSHLRLVRGSVKAKRESVFLIWFFLFLFVAILGSVFYLSSAKTLSLQFSYRTFFNLREVFRQEGLTRFMEEKRALRTQVEKALEVPGNSESYNFATNVAVYMFPDLLPDANFEKSIATENWAPLQEAIEKNAQSPESRLWFEEMRANIWNYESPDRAYPKLSPYAKETLRIYDELSTP